MEAGAPLLAALELAMREAALFAAAGFLILGMSDLAVDAIWIVRTLWRKLFIYRRHVRADAESLTPAAAPGPIAVFIPAWDEADVIGPMLRNTLTRFGDADYRLYVGCYPNDPGTIAAVDGIAHPAMRTVIGPNSGPTTKADCLNAIWTAMLSDERAEGRLFKAIVLHDAEDLAHPAELRLFDSLIERFDFVQLPVLPLIDRRSRWVSGHYIDEFCESHGKEMVVREALGAALPSAGVGCAFSRAILAAMADRNGGLPFDRDSLTEDYEVGLKLRSLGGRAAFVRLPAAAGKPVVATREHFPATIKTAVRQKARWIVGIALSGWDRLGWDGGLAEAWMRFRDRQSLIAALFLLSGYGALLLWALLGTWRFAVQIDAPPLPPALGLLVQINLAILAWRLLMRFAFVARAYGWLEGLRSIPRVLVSNIIALMAARRALFLYARIRKTGETRWSKTKHHFPAELPAE